MFKQLSIVHYQLSIINCPLSIVIVHWFDFGNEMNLLMLFFY